jgi:dienelactone hydrolase
MFEYFPDNYVWSLAAMGVLNRGAAISEVDEACRPLKEIAGRNDASAQEAWYVNWRKLAERVEGLAVTHEQAGEFLSAGRKYLRAASYFLAAERMMTYRDSRKLEAYRRGLASFQKGVRLRREPVEWVEIPLGEKSMPALFSPAAGKNPSPCMVHFDGFDVMKEIIYLNVGDEFRRRGISLLIVDHPGVGEALRLRNLHSSPDTEVPAAACVDYLEKRAEIDFRRIGMMALSLGGYYAPRAAAFEKRFRCCVAWGAMWDFGDRISQRLAGRGGEPSVPDSQNHLLWVFGKENLSEAVAVARQMSLEGVADKITCPLLIVHGQNDRQIPLWHAQKTFEASVNSPRKELKVFTPAEGGSEHCQVDNMTMAVDYISDWVARILGGDPKGF